jgi:hypothetical protein
MPLLVGAGVVQGDQENFIKDDTKLSFLAFIIPKL